MIHINFKYFIVDCDEVMFESTAQAKLTQKDLKDTAKFIEEHNYSPDFVDIPGNVYDKCIEKAYEKASQEYPDINERLDELEVILEQNIPISLINLLDEHIRQNLLEQTPSYNDEQNIDRSTHYSESDSIGKVKSTVLDHSISNNTSEALKQKLSTADITDTNMDESIVPTKNNTLYLPIKQMYFDEIIEGNKKKEYREVKPTTYKKYLKCDQRGNPFVDTSLIDMDDPLCDDINVWNDGIYPLIPNENYKFLHLAVGYNKERDEALVEIKDVTFEPLLDEEGKIFRFDEENGKAFRCENGKLCFWNIVYHLGQILNIQRKSGKAS